MARKVLPDDRIHAVAMRSMESFHPAIVDEVAQAIEAHTVVVVGMAQNPFPRKARKLLDAQGIRYHYISHGSYLTGWKPRLALKMWAGWPTFPMIFVHGALIGGSAKLAKLLESGELQEMLQRG